MSLQGVITVESMNCVGGHFECDAAALEQMTHVSQMNDVFGVEADKRRTGQQHKISGLSRAQCRSRCRVQW